jgi:hypothetical protein
MYRDMVTPILPSNVGSFLFNTEIVVFKRDID